MVRRKDSFWEYAEEIENGRFFICKFCEKRFAGGISRVKSHLAGVRGCDIQICVKVPEAIKLEALQATNTRTKRVKSVAALQVIDTPTKRDKSVAASINVLEGGSISGSSSSHMPNLCKAQDKSIVDNQFAKFFILERICLDAIESPLFKDFVNGIAEHGPGYELPSSLTLKSRLMPDIKKEVEEYVKNVIKYSDKTGCTLMYKNTSHFNLVDIFAYTPIGVVSMDPSPIDIREISVSKESISSIIKLIGATNVVQFIVNNDGDEKLSLTKDMLSRDYPWIYQTSCAAHGIGLLLNKIYEVPFVCNTLQVAKWIVLYIYKHKVNVSLRRLHKQENYIASEFFMLMSLLEVESELQALPVSIVTFTSDWGEKLNYEQVIQLFKKTSFIEYVIRCKEFWRRGKVLALVLQPLLQAHFLVQCDGPTSGYLYEMMKRVQAAVKQCSGSNRLLYDGIWKLVDEVQSEIIHPIHAVAAFLNPIYMCSEKFNEDVEMKNGEKYILEHLVAEKEKEAFLNEIQKYRMKDPNVFTPQAIRMLKAFHPRIWWEHCGNHLSVLQKYAIRILSQPYSSSCKQYQLRDNYNDDHVFMVNTMMMERYKSLETQMKEPIILDKLGEVSDDDGDDDWDDDYEKSFQHLAFCYDDGIVKDPAGSWLDRWPKQQSSFRDFLASYHEMNVNLF